MSISEAAHERKRRVLLELVNKNGAEGLATQGLLVNALRSSGQSVAGQQLWEPLEEGGVMSSLISKLNGLGLKIRVGSGEPPPT